MGYHRDDEYDSDAMESDEGFSDDGFGDVSEDNGSSWKVHAPLSFYVLLYFEKWFLVTSLCTHMYVGETQCSEGYNGYN